MTPNILTEAREMYRSLAQNRDIKDFEGELILNKFLLNTFHVGDYFYIIYYLPDQDIEYCSDGIRRLLKMEPDAFGLEYMLENIHPDDLPKFMLFEKTLLTFLPTLPTEKLTQYKVVYDYRIKGADGEYKRILHQLITLQNELDGAVIRTFGVFTYISHLKTTTDMQLNLICMNGEPSFYNIQDDGSHTSSESPLSEREKQVLAAMAEGLNSAEIAKRLEISKNTVDNHRKHILKKTDSQNSVEALQVALTGHWI
ncbi:MAG: LuxR C-terminal-related transcriptional regulator [Cryomorphaceae bacterium]